MKKEQLDDTYKQVEFERVVILANEVNDSPMVEGDSSREDLVEEEDSSEEEVHTQELPQQLELIATNK